MSPEPRDRTLEERLQGVQALARSVVGLRSLDVVRSPDLRGDLAAWMVAEAFHGVRSLPKAKRSWDVQVPSTGEQFRLLTLRYDPSSPRGTLEGRMEGFSHLVVALLTDEFHLRTLYKVPRSHVPLKTGVDGRSHILLTQLDPWLVNLRSLPGARRIAPLLAG